MIILFSIILICSIISIAICLQSYIYDDNLRILIANTIICLVSIIVIAHYISNANDKPKVLDKSTNTKDSIIVKDSLLILNTNDTVRVFNINKL